MTETKAEHPLGQGWWVTQDPSELTNQAVGAAKEDLRRELLSQREILEARVGRLESGITDNRAHILTGISDAVNALESLLVQRISGLEQIMKMLDEVLKNAPRERDELRERLEAQYVRQFAAEREFIMSQLEVVSTRMSEKFTAIDGQFAASKTAVDAALSAAKEAVAEQNKANSAAIKVSEGNTKEQLTSLGQVSSANFRAMEDKISDARDRLTSIEGLTRGIEQAGGKGTSAVRFEESQRRALISSVISALAVLVSLTAVVVLIIKK